MTATATAQKIDKDTVEFVRLGYAGASLDFRAPMANLATFRACMAVIGGYNEFSGTRVAGRLGALLGECMGVSVGREASVVIYAEIPFWTHQTMTAQADGWHGMGEHLTGEQREAIADRVRRLARELKADEITDVDSGSLGLYSIRLWWD